MKFDITILFALATVFLQSCTIDPSGPIPNLSPNELYPDPLGVNGFGSRVEGNDKFVLIGAEDYVHVFVAEGNKFVQVQKFNLRYFNFAVAEDHAVISFFVVGGKATKIYAFDGHKLVEEKTIDQASSLGMGDGTLIMGPLADNTSTNYALIYRKSASSWELSGRVDMPVITTAGFVDIGTTYAFTADCGTDKTVVKVYKFDGTTWTLNSTINGGRANFITSFEATDDYVGVSSYNLEIYDVKNPTAGPRIIPMENKYISDFAIAGNKVLVADFNLTFDPYRSQATVKLFSLSASETVLIGTFVSNNGYEADNFGMSVEVTDKVAFITCPGDGDAGMNTGSVYVMSY